MGKWTRRRSTRRSILEQKKTAGNALPPGAKKN
jgi:hypothetical protein